MTRNIVSLNNELIAPLWMVTGLRLVDRDLVISNMIRSSSDLNFFVITSDELLSEIGAKDYSRLCYSHIARWLSNKVEDAKEEHPYKNYHFLFELSPQLDIRPILKSLKKEESEEAFRLRGVIHAFNESTFLHDFNGRNGMLSKNKSVAESATEQFENSDFIIQASSSKNDIRSTYSLLRKNVSTFSIEQFASFFKKNHHLSFYDPKEMNNHINCYNSLNSTNSTSDNKLIYDNENRLHARRFFEVLKTWPQEIIRSQGVLWFSGKNSEPYSFTQMGLSTMYITPICRKMIKDLPLPIQTGQSRIAFISKKPDVAYSFMEKLDWSRQTHRQSNLETVEDLFFQQIKMEGQNEKRS